MSRSTPISQPAAAAANVAIVLAWARERMQAHGDDAPWLTALVLLEHATGHGQEALLAHPELQLIPRQVPAFRGFVERRCAREPLAYVVGYREFYGRRFEVTPATLIPRPETETLVDLALGYMEGKGAAGPLRLLDVGTGSGALAITLLAERPAWAALATDVNCQALRVAGRNARAHGVQRRLHLVACNLADAVKTGFPLVVANLPYVPSATIDALQPEVARYEPRQALDGGPDGMALLEIFLRSLPSVLVPGGAALLEIGEGQAETLTAEATRVLPACATRIEYDAAGAERFLVVERK